MFKIVTIPKVLMKNVKNNIDYLKKIVTKYIFPLYQIKEQDSLSVLYFSKFHSLLIKIFKY